MRRRDDQITKIYRRWILNCYQRFKTNSLSKLATNYRKRAKK